MKTNMFFTRAIPVSALMLLFACGPAENKDLGHSNFPKIENNNYYKEEEPSTNPAYTREDDTTKIEQKEKGTVDERQQ